eukprot:COSAG01_NODE_7095_length_3355_cov_2.836916_3_plen_164_part_00
MERYDLEVALWEVQLRQQPEQTRRDAQARLAAHRAKHGSDQSLKLRLCCCYAILAVVIVTLCVLAGGAGCSCTPSADGGDGSRKPGSSLTGNLIATRNHLKRFAERAEPAPANDTAHGGEGGAESLNSDGLDQPLLRGGGQHPSQRPPIGARLCDKLLFGSLA